MVTQTQKGVKQNVKSMVKVEFSEYKRIALSSGGSGYNSLIHMLTYALCSE
jgi:hypothetical protein